MSGHEQFDMDSMDEQDGSGSNSPEPAGPAIGLSTESGVSPEDRRTKATANADIELSRRAVPVIEVDEDVCSVCLDSFTQEDPGNRTGCGHCYHLQCIMQWAQRSRECPLCFKPLRLQDPALNELLPFGEYVPPDRLAGNSAHVLMGLDAWELERLLHRLATNGPTGGTRRERRSRSRAHILPSSVATRIPAGDDRGQRSRAGAQLADGAVSTSSTHGDDTSQTTSRRDMLPSSWPPVPSHARASTSPRAPQEARGQGGDNLRSRWAAVSSRCRESLSKTTRELKGRWGGATTHRSSGEGDSMQPYTSHSHQPPNGSAPGSSASSALPADERARAGVQG